VLPINPELKFVFPKPFNRLWHHLGLTDSDKSNLAAYISEYYQNAPINSRTNGFPGNLIQGTGGAIKLRFEQESSHRGKSGSYRIIYFTLVQETVYFLTIYAKKDQANLTDEQKQKIQQTIHHLRHNYRSPKE
jgi:hypothetical protein